MPEPERIDTRASRGAMARSIVASTLLLNLTLPHLPDRLSLREEPALIALGLRPQLGSVVWVVPPVAPATRHTALRGVARWPCYTAETMNCRLSDEHLTAIAWAEPSETTAALARRLGAAYHAVYRARRRLRVAGGWWCALALSTCTECGRPLLFNAHTVPRQVHPACERARVAEHTP